MPSLIGFRPTGRKQKSSKGGSGGSGGFSDTEALTLLKKKFLAGTEAGEFSSVYDVKRYMDVLNSVPETDKVAIEKADMEVVLRKFAAREKEVMFNKTIFEENTQRLLNEFVTTDGNGNIAGMPGIIANYAEVYALKAEEYANNVMADAYSKYGTDQKIPDEVLSYAKELEEKSAFYRDIYNSYVPGPDGQTGRLMRENIAFVPKLNQATGEMIGFDIKPRNEIDSKDYMATDTPVSLLDGGTPIPMYLPAINAIDDAGNSYKKAKFGEIEYEQVKQEGANGAVKYGDALVAKDRDTDWFGDEKNKQFNTYLKDSKSSGLNLSNGNTFKFKPNNIIPESVSTTRGHLFYTDSRGKSIEVEGANQEEKFSNLETYLKNIGKDPSTLISRDQRYSTGGARIKLAPPDIFDQVTEKISEKSLSPIRPDEYGPFMPGRTVPTAPQTPAPMPPPRQDSYFAKSTQSTQQGGIQIDGAMRVNRENKPDASKESVGGKTWVNDVIAKGRSIFTSSRNT